MTATELFAECASCPSWQVLVFSDAEKRRLEDKHNARKHAETAENITELLYDDPTHTADREAVEQAIRTVARYNHGLVDVNKVRKQIPAWVNPRVTSAVYGAWSRRGLLYKVGKVPNLDSDGRNANKELPLYRLREAS